MRFTFVWLMRLHLIAAWREAEVFTVAERAALELTEQGTRALPTPEASPTRPGGSGRRFCGSAKDQRWPLCFRNGASLRCV